MRHLCSDSNVSVSGSEVACLEAVCDAGLMQYIHCGSFIFHIVTYFEAVGLNTVSSRLHRLSHTNKASFFSVCIKRVKIY